MPRLTRLPIVLSAAVLGAALAGASASTAGAGVHIAAASQCISRNVPDPGDPHHFVYYDLITTKGVGCSTRNTVENKFEACRLKHGLRGRCSTKQLGFSCKESGARQPGALPGQFNARVACRRGSAQFSYFYEQN